MARVGLTKKQRFEVFKRDQFVCQYCGRHPPAVVLEVDHITAVASGGTNEPHNLLTSCFDCNRGKAAGTLEAVPIDAQAKAELLAERLEQARAYDALLRVAKDDLEHRVDQVIAVYEAAFPKWTLNDTTRPSIKRFLEKLPAVEVEDSMERACQAMKAKHSESAASGYAFRYFCGICWNKIKEPKQ